jgi:hypothetical protein
MADAREPAEQAIAEWLSKCSCTPYEAGGDGPERDCMVHGDPTWKAKELGHRLLDGPVPLAYLPDAFQPLLDLRRPFGVYEDCGHRHSEGDEGVTCVDDIGLTCAKLYDICAECCRDGDCQSEACAGHDRDRCWPCPTVAALPAGLREASGR